MATIFLGMRTPAQTLSNYRAAVAVRAMRTAEARERERLLQLYQSLPIIGYVPALVLARRKG
jgi:hypothetical protein